MAKKKRWITLCEPAGVQYDVFHVSSFTDGTPMEGRVEVDFFTVLPGRQSAMHLHRKSDTLLFALEGEGAVLVEDRGRREEIPLHAKGGAIWFDKGVLHCVVTKENPLTAISIQIPGIKRYRRNGEMVLDLITKEERERRRKK